MFERSSARSRRLALVLSAFLCALTNQSSQAGSATWQLDPAGNDWNAASNWMPNTVPNGPGEIATFEVSDQTDVSVNKPTEVNEIVFAPGASAFQITAQTSATLILSGVGISNNSGLEQNFVAATSPDTNVVGTIAFTNSATAGEGTLFTVESSRKELGYGAAIQFSGTSKAGTASFVIDGGTEENSPGGNVNFSAQASADHATFTIHGAAGNGFSSGGSANFRSKATAGNATFVCEGSDNPNGYRGGGVVFENHATAGQSTIIVNGGISRSSSLAYFGDRASAGTAHITVNPAPQGSGAVGGSVEFLSNSSGETAQITLHGYPEHGPEDGLLNIHFHNHAATVGSLMGDGAVQLGINELIVGGLDTNMTFSGPINDEQGKGSLTKTGRGRLLLRGVSTYGGGTTVNQGELNVSTKGGSGTGSGPVQVNGAVLSGGGIIGGAVILGADALLLPTLGFNRPTVFTIQGSLTFDDGSLYTAFINTFKNTADQVVANGVTIASGAELNLDSVGHRRLPVGRTFTLLQNTSPNPISGNFADLPEGATVAAQKNTYQVSYAGGDGNDLTLTVVPRP